MDDKKVGDMSVDELLDEILPDPLYWFFMFVGIGMVVVCGVGILAHCRIQGLL